MTPEDVKKLIAVKFDEKDVFVQGEGSMFETRVVSDDFEGLSLVKKQQLVYATVNEYITNGDIHALTIKTYTHKEWESASKLKLS